MYVMFMLSKAELKELEWIIAYPEVAHCSDAWYFKGIWWRDQLLYTVLECISVCVIKIISNTVNHSPTS